MNKEILDHGLARRSRSGFTRPFGSTVPLTGRKTIFRPAVMNW